MSEVVMIHQPAGADGQPSHPSLSREGFDAQAFLGKWYVIQSTLPMWKNKKDVSISYAIHTPSPLLRLTDHVQYRSLSSPPSSPPSSVLGISSLLPTPHGAHFKWRGSGLLFIASSKWQVIGYDLEQGGGWAVTMFEKTLFTPAGLDIYCRSERGLAPELEAEIVRQVKALGGEAGKLAEAFFEVKRTGSGSAS